MLCAIWYHFYNLKHLRRTHPVPLCQWTHLQQISTQAVEKIHHPSATVRQNTPVPLFPHPQFLSFCKSQLMSPAHHLVMPFPIVSTRHFRRNKINLAPLPVPPLQLGFLSLPLLSPLVFNRMFPRQPILLAAIEVSHLQQIHTQVLAKNHNPSSTACPHTPALHSHTFNPTHSARASRRYLHITSWSPSTIVCTCQFCGSKKE